MKNMRIEKVLNEWSKGNFELGLSSAACVWCRRYKDSIEKGFDEIVIDEQECVHLGDVAEMLEAAKEFKIEYFVYASGFSGAFSVVNEMTNNGARVGKFVVKTYERNIFGEVEKVEVSGMRINL